jgi:D-alanyl-D-alanine carboxypeptidase/D-alanyl-D-alanine-endopeptidase (penicillin-binding protein 4)
MGVTPGRRAVAGAAVLATALALTLPAAWSASASSTASPSPGVVPAPPEVPTDVLAPVVVEAGSVSPSPSGSPAGVLDLAAVRAALGAPALGADVAAVVTDALTGTVVLDAGGSRPQTPASTVKTVTAAAALRLLGPDARLVTRVVTGSVPGQIVLVGAGDATLTRLPLPLADLPAGQAARPASMSDLVARTVAALRAEGIAAVTVAVDDSLFSGPRVSPGWPPSYVATGVVSPVSALSVDGGQVSADSRVRDRDPALAAGAALVTGLRQAGITVTGTVSRAAASTTAEELAAVSSPSVADLVERMLTESDNDLAEALAHLTGAAAGFTASFEGGAAAARATVDALGVPSAGLRLLDGSGLARDNLLPAGLVAGVLAAVVDDLPPAGSREGVLWPVASGLPVAGVTGTLAERFDLPATRPGRGAVRAKTGTLTGVAALAGLAVAPDGRVLGFAFLADAVPGDPLAAQAALDRAATALLRRPR